MKRSRSTTSCGILADTNHAHAATAKTQDSFDDILAIDRLLRRQKSHTTAGA